MSDSGHIDAIVQAARHALVRGDAVDVGKVAAEVGVDRSTVFRRVGRRDALVAEALWSFTERFWPDLLSAHPPGSAHRAAEVLSQHARLLIEESWFRSFLNRDPQRAFRVLTTADTPIQARMVALVRELLSQEPPPRVDLPLDDLAYLVVRIGESFVYSDLIAGKRPDADLARATYIALLG